MKVLHYYGNGRRLLPGSFVRSVSSGKGRNGAHAGTAAGYTSSVRLLVAARGYAEASLGANPLQ